MWYDPESDEWDEYEPEDDDDPENWPHPHHP
jgi:hypothetical protein